MSVAVIVPWLGGCEHRERARDWCLARHRYPVTLAEGSEPWCKARAVMPAVRATSAEIVVVADADCWTDGLAEAVAMVEAGRAWAVPHRDVHRLSRTATEQLLAGGPADGLEQEPYLGVVGGGFVIAPRDAILAIPLDPRFVGWGQEDRSWGMALEAVLGPPWRGTGPLIHLWHPPQQRLDRVIGSMDGWRLQRRYTKARWKPEAMAALLTEANALLEAA